MSDKRRPATELLDAVMENGTPFERLVIHGSQGLGPDLPAGPPKKGKNGKASSRSSSDVAPVGVAIIAKDAEQTLGTCLASLRPYVRQIVVCVDKTTTDKTAEVAKGAGADILVPIQVSDWHE